ncbi:DUF1648 domain-containing protein [Aeribacillus alveayuensis]|uniref:Membrane protein n=1 Tax=Aeribacillus alveayuensis TaxID=279215 RepID=A0ABT9VRS3_9BACI|nr:putative membrane protein [Bacillus alveayuensis]
MMKTKTNRFLVILTSFSYLLSLIVILYVLDEVAIHWDTAGEADGYSNKWFGAFILNFHYDFGLVVNNLFTKNGAEKSKL